MGKSRYFCSKALLLYLLIVVFFCGKNNCPARDFYIRKSAHFIIKYKECAKKFLDKLVERVEDGYREITQKLGFFREEPWLWENRAEIYIYNSREEYLQFTGMPSWSSGCAQPLKKLIYTYCGSYDFFNSTLDHELTHLIFREYIKDAIIPLWLDEGVAMYIEVGRDFQFLVRKIKGFILSNSYIPCEELFKIEREDLGMGGAEASWRNSNVEKFYLQSLSLVYFLLERYGKYKFKLLCRTLRRGGNFNQVFFKTYRAIKDIKDLERQWKEFYH